MASRRRTPADRRLGTSLPAMFREPVYRPVIALAIGVFRALDIRFDITGT